MIILHSSAYAQVLYSIIVDVGDLKPLWLSSLASWSVWLQQSVTAQYAQSCDTS